MATTNTWDQVVQKITGVVNRGAFSKTYTPSTSRQTQNGSAGYYSSITTVCNAVSLSGNASASHVLSGKTFYTTSLTRQTGTMANRGNLNWSGSNTTYSVPAGYYSGGTLDSRTSYNNGYNAGVAAYRMTYANLRFSGKSKEFATVGTYTATRTGPHLFVFNKSSQAQPNDMDGRALLNGAVISSFEGASYSGSSSGNTYSWKFAVSLTSGNVVTFQLRNHYSGSYTTIIDGAVAF